MRRRILASLLTFTAVVVLFAGVAFLLTLLLIDAADMEDPSPLRLWFDQLGRAAYRNPLAWYGIGSVAVLTTFAVLAGLGARIGERRDSSTMSAKSILPPWLSRAV